MRPSLFVGPVTRRPARREQPNYRRLVGTTSTSNLNFERVPAALDVLEMTAYRRVGRAAEVRSPLETMTRFRIDHTAIGAGGSIVLADKSDRSRPG